MKTNIEIFGYIFMFSVLIFMFAYPILYDYLDKKKEEKVKKDKNER